MLGVCFRNSDLAEFSSTEAGFETTPLTGSLLSGLKLTGGMSELAMIWGDFRNLAAPSKSLQDDLISLRAKQWKNITNDPSRKHNKAYVKLNIFSS